MTNIDTIERLQAIRDNTAELGFACTDEDIHFLDYSYDTAYDFAVGKTKAWADDATAVFAANDEMAAGIIDAAMAAGLSPPADITVVGFDDTRVASMTRPRLTTVHVPMSNMGATAVDLLFRRIADPSRPSTKTVLASQLVIRESCGAGMGTAV